MKEGWSYKKLGGVCDFEGGSQPPKSEWINHPQDGYVRMLQIRDFTRSRNAEIEYVKISKKIRLCKADDILIGRYGASVGKILTGLAGAYNVAIIKSIPNEELISKAFIKRYFEARSFQRVLFKVCASRAAQAGFSKDDICDTPIPVPPLSEQHSIVSRLDTAFSHIDALKANAEKQLNEARKLFQAELTECMKPKEGWEEKKLGEVATIQNGFAFKSNLFKKEGEPIIRISNIQNECIETKDIVYFCKEDYFVNFDNYRIFPNDILIAMSGGTTGKLGINRTNSIFYQNQRIGVIRENKKVLNHFYLYYFLQTKSEESLKIAAGAAQPNLSTAQIKNFIIPIIPLSVQKAIVSHLDSLSSTIRKLEELQQKTIAECDALKQAMLREVFE